MKTMKRTMALVLSLIMAMALCVTAYADDTKTVKLEISNPVADHTYTVYQLLTGDVADLEGGSGTLSNVKIGSSVKTDVTVDAVKTAVMGDKTGGALSDAAYTLIDTDKGVATLSTNSTSAQVVPGYYVIVDTAYSGTDKTNVVYSRNMVAVVGDTTVTPKTSTPTVDKKITNTNDANKPMDSYGKTDTAAIGDVINYAITGTVPNTTGYSYYYYILNDTLSAGLTFNNDITVTIQKTGFDPVSLTEDNDYYVYTGEQTSDGHTFEVAFKDMKTLYATYGEGAIITVSYTATVNENAVIGTDANTNDVYLQYSNKPNDSTQSDKEGKPGTPDTTTKDPTGKTPTYTTKTYVTELNLSKVDQDGEALQGAEFTLTGTNLNKVIIKTYTKFEESAEGTYWKLTDGTYTTEAPITEDIVEGSTTIKANADKYDSVEKKYKETVSTETITTGASDKKVVVTVGADGKIKFTGLNIGEYTLSETKTPDGYNTVGDIKFTISANQSNATEFKGGDITWTSDNDGVKLDGGTFYVTVKNQKGDTLPSTGGIGTTIFYVVGSILVLGAAVVLVTKKRMSR